MRGSILKCIKFEPNSEQPKSKLTIGKEYEVIKSGKICNGELVPDDHSDFHEMKHKYKNAYLITSDTGWFFWYPERFFKTVVIRPGSMDSPIINKIGNDIAEILSKL